jgi:hypothetical protein
MPEQDPRKQTLIAIKILSIDDEPNFEVLPATNLGGDLYRLESPAFLCPELSRFDIIRCVESKESRHPLYMELVKASGHQIIGCRFVNDFDKKNVPAFFNGLGIKGITHFVWVHPGYLVDMEPGVDMRRLVDVLNQDPSVSKVTVYKKDILH